MKKILIWGTGDIARQVTENQICAEILGFIETNRTKEKHQGKKVYGIDEIPQEYDFIIVANSFSGDIYNICRTKNIPLDKVIFIKGIKKREGFSDAEVIREILGEENFTDYCSEFGLPGSSFFKDDLEKYKELNRRENFRIQDSYIWPEIQDKYMTAGTMGNYFWQDLWAARHIIKSGVKNHFDIGSRLDGFIAHLLAADITVTVIDVREFPVEAENLHTIVDDATILRQLSYESVESMSALCSLEHFGLGRYGDPVDPEACFKCFDNMQKKLKKGGRLYLSVPIGKERVEFNAHRVFYASTVTECFSSLKLEEFSCVADGKIEYGADIHQYDNDLHNGEYRYGLFSFIK